MCSDFDLKHLKINKNESNFKSGCSGNQKNLENSLLKLSSWSVGGGSIGSVFLGSEADNFLPKSARSRRAWAWTANFNVPKLEIKENEESENRLKEIDLLDRYFLCGSIVDGIELGSAFLHLQHCHLQQIFRACCTFRIDKEERLTIRSSELLKYKIKFLMNFKNNNLILIFCVWYLIKTSKLFSNFNLRYFYHNQCPRDRDQRSFVTHDSLSWVGRWSIAERRRPINPTFWRTHSSRECQFEERWFPGLCDHSTPLISQLPSKRFENDRVTSKGQR